MESDAWDEARAALDRALALKDPPPEAHYRHNDFRVRTVHMHDDESPNGHAHCLQLMLGTSQSIPVLGGELMLGTWQRIFLVELDGPRAKREVLVQTIGMSGDDDDEQTS